MMKQQRTVDIAKYWAEQGTEILFSEDKVLSETLDKETLKDKLYGKILANLVDFDTFEITEDQFAECVNQSKIS